MALSPCLPQLSSSAIVPPLKIKDIQDSKYLLNGHSPGQEEQAHGLVTLVPRLAPHASSSQTVRGSLLKGYECAAPRDVHQPSLCPNSGLLAELLEGGWGLEGRGALWIAPGVSLHLWGEQCQMAPHFSMD